MNIVLILVFVRRTAMTLNWTRLYYGLSQPMPFSLCRCCTGHLFCWPFSSYIIPFCSGVLWLIWIVSWQVVMLQCMIRFIYTYLFHSIIFFFCYEYKLCAVLKYHSLLWDLPCLLWSL